MLNRLFVVLFKMLIPTQAVKPIDAVAARRAENIGYVGSGPDVDDLVG